MSEPRYRDWILETIDSLRSRKARPDLERICRMVRRRHGSDPDRTRSELEKLIQEQTVLKVSYKGSISYRNAAKVQRKSRKKTEQTTGSGGAVGEQTKYAKSKNSDSAHSPTETKETGGKDSGLIETKHYSDPKPKTTTIAAEKTEAVLVPASGNCLSCGAAVCKSQARCSAGSGGVKASAQKDKKLPQTESRSVLTGRDTITSDDTETGTPSKTRGSRGVEAGLSGHEGSNDKEKKTCTSASASNSHPPGHKQQASLKHKLGVGAKAGSRGGSDPASPDLGDQLVASVRSLVEKSRGAAAARGPTPLGLKEILGFLSSQERLSQEKLTRSKVKVVLEREVARGRLRRTRFGNITLPVRGVGAAKPSARLLKSALQDRHMAKKVEVKKVATETECVTEERVAKTRDGSVGTPGSPGTPDKGAAECLVPKREAGVQGVARGNSSQTLSCPDPDPISMDQPQATPLLGSSVSADITDLPCSAQGNLHPISSSDRMCPSGCFEDMQTELQGDTGEPEVGVQPRAVCPSAQRETAKGAEEVTAEESALTPDQLVSDSQNQVMAVGEGGNLTTSVPAESCSGFKMEVDEASCLLTPTASPQDSRGMEEREMNGGVFVKAERDGQNPVEWSVADVVSYFTEAGFPEQASAFRTQEIDGKSLLLMQRNDVLTGLSIRLGPALKIYERHVKVLQRTHFQDDGAFC
ncbi:atherin-like [Anguilla anguilla]|uniref:atherin-like n=1 Tax=Anguilla anguilla TaxID=7936 RepID=UPI0015AE71D5|nr:atherin-like [Anguilla anguilla]